MADPKHIKILKQGAEAFNEWRKNNLDVRPDLNEADLSETHLKEANLSGADLRKTKLFNADLQWADLSGANLYEAYLYKADLKHTNLEHTLLVRANFCYAKLNYAILNNANLRAANFHGANLSNAELKSANLSRAALVETVLYGADLSNSCVYGISAWNLKTDQDTKQLDLVITEKGEPIINVDNIEIAQFIHLLLKHENLRQVINSVTQKGVLILGRFGGGGIEVLHAVAEKLRETKYLPIIFDFDRPRVELPF